LFFLQILVRFPVFSVRDEQTDFPFFRDMPEHLKNLGKQNHLSEKQSINY